MAYAPPSVPPYPLSYTPYPLQHVPYPTSSSAFQGNSTQEGFMGYYSNVNEEPSVFEAGTSNEDVGDRALVSYEGDDCEYMEAE